LDPITFERKLIKLEVKPITFEGELIISELDPVTFEGELINSKLALILKKSRSIHKDPRSPLYGRESIAEAPICLRLKINRICKYT
jgi:hypothetical protein